MKFRAVRQGEMESTAAAEHHSGECLGCTWHDIKVAPAQGREPRLRRMVYLDSELSKITDCTPRPSAPRMDATFKAKIEKIRETT
jgi:hypothetical protein